MQKQTIEINWIIIPYILNTSHKLKRLSMRRTTTWELIVNQPNTYSSVFIEKFLNSKSARILKHRWRFQEKKGAPDLSTYTREHFLTHRQSAYNLVVQKVEEWSKIIPYPYNTIRVKQLKTKRWSCSSKKNLNFNYKILFLPESLQDYLVVHEMCHLKEMNHSHRFWDLVEQYYWPYTQARKQLKYM